MQEPAQQEHRVEGHLPVFLTGDRLSVAVENSLDIFNMEGSLLDRIELDCRVTALGCSPDGRLLAAGTVDGRLLVVDPDRLEVAGTSHYTVSPVESVAWGSGRISTKSGQTVKIWYWDEITGEFGLARSLQGWGTAVRTVDWSPDGSSLVVTRNRYGPISVTKLNGSRILDIDSEIDGQYILGSMSPDGTMIASLTDEGLLDVRDSRFGSLVARYIDFPAFSLSWSPVNSKVMALAGYGSVRVVDLTADDPILMRIELEDYALSVDWSPDGKSLAIGTPSRIEIWDPWIPLLRISLPSWRFPYAIAFSPDGSKTASLAGFDPDHDAGQHPSRCMGTNALAQLKIWTAGG